MHGSVSARTAIRPAAPRRARGRATFPTLAAATLMGAAMLAAWPRDDSTVSLWAGAAFLLCGLGCWRGLGLHPLSPAMVYLYVFGVFHLGLVVPWGLGLDIGAPPAWLRDSNLGDALFLVVAALMSFWAGAALAVWKWPASAEPARREWFHNHILAWCGLVVFLAGCGLFLWGAWTIGFDRLSSANYFEIYKLTNWYDPRFFVTSLTVAPIGLYLMAAGVPRGRLGWTAALAALWSGTIFVLGFRGFGLIPVITILAVLHKRGVNASRWAYAAGGVVLLVAIPTVTVMRDARLGERSTIEALETARPLAAVNEMGASLRPLVHTVHYMEAETPRAGATYWRGLLAVLPNLSLDWQGGSYVPLDELPPSHWVTKQAAPWIYRHFGGLGFSAVAEPYMNFGTPGVVAFFFLLPLALIGVDRMDASRPTRLALWAVLLGPLLWTTRNSFGTFFRPALMGLLAVGAARFISNSAASEQVSSIRRNGKFGTRVGGYQALGSIRRSLG